MWKRHAGSSLLACYQTLHLPPNIVTNVTVVLHVPSKSPTAGWVDTALTLTE